MESLKIRQLYNWISETYMAHHVLFAILACMSAVLIVLVVLCAISSNPAEEYDYDDENE